MIYMWQPNGVMIEHDIPVLLHLPAVITLVCIP